LVEINNQLRKVTRGRSKLRKIKFILGGHIDWGFVNSTIYMKDVFVAWIRS